MGKSTLKKSIKDKMTKKECESKFREEVKIMESLTKKDLRVVSEEEYSEYPEEAISSLKPGAKPLIVDIYNDIYDGIDKYLIIPDSEGNYPAWCKYSDTDSWKRFYFYDETSVNGILKELNKAYSGDEDKIVRYQSKFTTDKTWSDLGLEFSKDTSSVEGNTWEFRDSNGDMIYAVGIDTEDFEGSPYYVIVDNDWNPVYRSKSKKAVADKMKSLMSKIKESKLKNSIRSKITKKECDDPKKIDEGALSEFSKNDWYAYAGADNFEDGSSPLIYDDEDVTVVVSGDPDGGAVVEVDLHTADVEESYMQNFGSKKEAVDTAEDIISDMVNGTIGLGVFDSWRKAF